MSLDDEDICDALWKEDECSVNSESEFSDDSGCDSNTVVKFLSCSKQIDNSNDEDNVNDDSDMQHGTRTKVGAERHHFPFSGNPRINVGLEDPNNPLEYFELLVTPELAEIISRETNQYAQKFLENTPHLKTGSIVCQ
jgi:hypothetical protein